MELDILERSDETWYWSFEIAWYIRKWLC